MTGLLSTAGDVLLGALALALLPAFVRLLRGPSLPDRVVALDLIMAIAVGMSALYATMHEEPAFLDVAILIALISFVGTVAFAHYIERRRIKPDDF
jgi:multicomponent Na+:H+ antiporter subunit F